MQEKNLGEDLELEKNFMGYDEISDQGYFLSNYVILNGKNEIDVLISEQKAEKLLENHGKELLEVEREKKTFGELFEEKDIPVKLYSTLARSYSNGEQEMVHQFEKVVDTTEKYLDIEPYREGTEVFRCPSGITEKWGASTFKNGEKLEWELKGLNWPMLADILEKEDISDYRELEDLEVVYNEVKHL